jgi:ATP/maltotriose-dependent transcriptional regulator MalT
MQGEVAHASRVSRTLADEAEAAGDVTMALFGHAGHAAVLAFQGQAAAAHAAARSALAAAETMGGVTDDSVYAVFAYAALAGGDAIAARRAAETAWQRTHPLREVFTRSQTPLAEAALACGDLAAARRWADDTVAVAPGWWQMDALTVRAYVAIAQGEPDQAEPRRP